MKSPKYLTIGDLVSIISLILNLKVLLIFLEGCLCINRVVDFEKFKHNLFFLNQNTIFFNLILIRFCNDLNFKSDIIKYVSSAYKVIFI